MSSVIGIAILLVITVLLTTVAGALFYDFANQPDPAPGVVLETEKADDGVRTVIKHTGGDRLDDRVRLRGVSDPHAIADSAPFDDGDTVTVLPTDDTIQVVWRGGNTEHLIGTLTTTDIGSSLTIDRTCGDFTPGSDITVDNEVLKVTGCPLHADELDVTNTGVILGDARVDDETMITEGFIYGTVRGDEDLDLTDGSVYGEVNIDADLTLENGSVDGRVDADGEVKLSDGSTTSGPIDTADKADILSGSSVDGDLDSGEDVTLADGQVNGRVDADGEVKFSNGSASAGPIDTPDDIDLLSGSSTGGPIDSGKDVTIDGGSTVDGDADAGNEFDLLDGSAVDGSVTAPGGVTVSGSTVAGSVESTSSDLTISDSDIGGPATGNADVDVTSATVDGDLTAPASNAEVDLEDGTTINGDVAATDGEVTIGDDVTVTGDIDANSIDCNGDNATINGQDCEDY